MPEQRLLLSYSAVKLFSKYSNLCDHGTSTSQTDGQRDRQTTYCGITALCVVSRGKKIANQHQNRSLRFAINHALIRSRFTPDDQKIFAKIRLHYTQASGSDVDLLSGVEPTKIFSLYCA